jgi:two-component system, cell cycle response regulator
MKKLFARQECALSSESTIQPIKVLVVEEDPRENTPWSQEVLERSDPGQYEATHVHSLSKALVALEEGTFDVILLDLSLPDSKGMGTFSQMYGRSPEVPIVVIAPLEDRTQAVEILREGAQDYLIKGETTAEQLRRALVFAIERNHSRLILHQLSFNDELTGLLNRRGFHSMAHQQLKVAERENWELVILFADLDSLKNINDNFGHTEGDRALKTASLILKETFRTSDLIARLGGDEFIVLALNAPATGVQKMLERLQGTIAQHNSQNRYYQLSLSVGIAQFDPHQGLTLDEMIVQADKALYENKRRRG